MNLLFLINGPIAFLLDVKNIEYGEISVQTFLNKCNLIFYMRAKYYVRLNTVVFGKARKGNKLSFHKRHRLRMLTTAVIFLRIK